MRIYLYAVHALHNWSLTLKNIIIFIYDTCLQCPFLATEYLYERPSPSVTPAPWPAPFFNLAYFPWLLQRIFDSFRWVCCRGGRGWFWRSWWESWRWRLWMSAWRSKDTVSHQTECIFHFFNSSSHASILIFIAWYCYIHFEPHLPNLDIPLGGILNFRLEVSRAVC